MLNKFYTMQVSGGHTHFYIYHGSDGQQEYELIAVCMHSGAAAAVIAQIDKDKGSLFDMDRGGFIVDHQKKPKPVNTHGNPQW